MRLRFILIFGNKLIHSYNHDFNYHPNLQHRTIHSTIYSDDWLANKKNTYNNIRNGQKKLGVDYVEMGMQRVMDRYGVGKKTGTSVLLTD